VFVGGIAASLMHSRFLTEPRWHGVRFIRGLLSDPPAVALQLDEFSEELYAGRHHGQPIEDLVPDIRHPPCRSITNIRSVTRTLLTLREVAFENVTSAVFPKLEGEQRDTESLTGLSEPSRTIIWSKKKDLILMDNNVVASPRFKELSPRSATSALRPGRSCCARECGSPWHARVDFNQELTLEFYARTGMYLRRVGNDLA